MSPRTRLALDSMRDFASPAFGVHIYKLEPPALLRGVPDPDGPTLSRPGGDAGGTVRRRERPCAAHSAPTDRLADAGRLIRHHGGAAMPSSVANSANAERRGEFAPEKARLAHTLAQWLPDRSSRFRTPRTTMLALALALAQAQALAQALHVRKGLEIVTNHLEAAQTRAALPDIEVIVLGGRLQPRNLSVSGTGTLAAVEQYRGDLCLFSAGCMAADGSLLECHEAEADVACPMQQRARQRVLVVDHSKSGRTASVRIGGIDEMDAGVTDQPVPAPLSRRLRAHGVNVLLPAGRPSATP